MTAISGTTSTGFEYTIPEGISTDWNFVRAYRKMVKASTDMERFDGASELVEAIFCDKDEEEQFYKHLASQHNGRVPIKVLFTVLNEIVGALGANTETKN